MTSAVRRSVLRPRRLDRVGGRRRPRSAAARPPRRRRPAAASPRLIGAPDPRRPAEDDRRAAFQAHATDERPGTSGYHHMLADSEIMSLSGTGKTVSQRRIAGARQRVRAVEPVRVLDDHLIGRLPVGAQDDPRRDHREGEASGRRGRDRRGRSGPRTPARQRRCRSPRRRLPLGDVVEEAPVGCRDLSSLFTWAIMPNRLTNRSGPSPRERHRIADETADR